MNSIYSELDTRCINIWFCDDKLIDEIIEWAKERNLETIYVPSLTEIPTDHKGKMYCSLFKNMASDVWFDDKRLAIEFKLRFGG